MRDCGCDAVRHLCGRCCWQPPDVSGQHTDLDWLRSHAAQAEHPICVVCTRRSLTEHEPQACGRCVNQAAEHLAGIALLYDRLTLLRGHLHSATGSAGQSGPRGAGDGRPLLGGDLVALLGKGSAGLAEDGETTKDNDPISVAYELGWWENDWRERRRQQPARTGRSASRELHDAVAYLQDGHRWAALSHPAFEEYSRDLRRIHEGLERAALLVRDPVKAAASCFDCGGDLIRPVTRDGLENEQHVVCRQCSSTYGPQRYLLALAARRQSGLDGWVPYRAAAKAAQRPVATLWSWVQRLHVPAVCRVEDGTVLVWYPAVAERVREAARRREELAKRREERRRNAGEDVA